MCCVIFLSLVICRFIEFFLPCPVLSFLPVFVSIDLRLRLFFSLRCICFFCCISRFNVKTTFLFLFCCMHLTGVIFRSAVLFVWETKKNLYHIIFMSAQKLDVISARVAARASIPVGVQLLSSSERGKLLSKNQKPKSVPKAVEESKKDKNPAVKDDNKN